MNSNHMTWERWQKLTDDQKEFEHFQYHVRLSERMHILEKSRLKNGLIQFFGSFAGGATAVAGFLFLCKDVIK